MTDGIKFRDSNHNTAAHRAEQHTPNDGHWTRPHRASLITDGAL